MGINREELLAELIAKADLGGDDYFELASQVAKLLPTELTESLDQLVNGPVFDGDIISKSRRDVLIGIGLGIRVCCKGEQGFTGGTYFAYSVNRALKSIQ